VTITPRGDDPTDCTHLQDGDAHNEVEHDEATYELHNKFNNKKA